MSMMPLQALTVLKPGRKIKFYLKFYGFVFVINFIILFIKVRVNFPGKNISLEETFKRGLDMVEYAVQSYG